MSIAGIPNAQGLSHEQFGDLVDGIHEIVSNFQEKHSYRPPEQADGEQQPETRSTAFQPIRYGQSSAQPRTSWPSPSAYSSGSLMFADH